MAELALITPTSDRPLAFNLCEKWMRRAIERYGRPVVWYVVDDGQTPVNRTLGQVHLRRPRSASGSQSFLANLLCGLKRVTEEKILFIEDDDWYSADYLAVMSSRLDEAAIAGEAQAKYYSVSHRRFKVWDNREHASLCQTGIRRELVDSFIKIVESTATPFVDMPLWKSAARTTSRKLTPESRHSIGIKGLPGKTGMTEGHSRTPDWDEDPEGKTLCSWIGEEDMRVYLE